MRRLLVIKGPKWTEELTEAKRRGLVRNLEIKAAAEYPLAGTVSQSVILTRYADKTAMPAGEELASLAQHGATMAIHLGVNHLEKILVELLPHYGADCPIAVIHRATWPDQDWVVGTLEDITDKVEAKGFRRTALILVGRVLGSEQFSESSLYRAGHAHLYRQ